MFVRNLAGGIRDTAKDTKEGMKTIATVIGWTTYVKHIHLLAIMTTSLIWWWIADISWIWLVIVYIIEIGTYHITPR